MKSWRGKLVAVATLLLASAPGCRRDTASSRETPTNAAAPAESPALEVDASARTLAVVFPSGNIPLHGDVLVPPGRGPFPVVVYNHGSEREPDLDGFGEIGEYFRAKGYVAFFPYRRGSGGSPGTYWEDQVGRTRDAERSAATLAALEAENADVMAAVAWIAQQPYADAARVAVAGCSFGGIHTLLAAENGQGLYAAVDFAGASMAWSSSPLLQERLKQAARHARVPVFLLQAENDFNTTPSLVLSAEMADAGLPRTVKIFPPHGTTAMQGHAGFCTHGEREWGPDVLAFLAAQPAAKRP